MNNKLKIEKCSKCENLFKRKIELGKDEDGKMQVFFKCPKCSVVYHCYYETKETLGIQKEIDDLNNQLRNTRPMRKGMDFKTEFNKRQEKLQKLKKLREKKKKLLYSLNKNNNKIRTKYLDKR